MKTWIFSEDKLDEAIEEWLQAQLELNHPKANTHAAFVAQEIKTVLLNKKLFKESETPDITPNRSVINKSREVKSNTAHQYNEKPSSSTLSVNQLKKEWNNF